MRRFNVTGVCIPSKHYMVDISGKLDKIVKLVENGDYFTINRARQYGKTTTLSHLRRLLNDEYICISISFEGLDDESFESPSAFCAMFLLKIHDALQFSSAPETYASEWLDDEVTSFLHWEGMSQNYVKTEK